MRVSIKRYARLPVLAMQVLLFCAAAVLSGCVTPIPLAQEAPDLNYKSARPIGVAVIDDRDVLREGHPPTFIGRAHGVFGIPSDLQAYPWFVSDSAKKDQTLAQALEERIVVGLNDEGWQMTAAAFPAAPTKEQIVAFVAAHGTQRLLVLTLTQWFVSLNLNWVGAFNFDWGYRAEVLDGQGATLASVSDSGRDVVDEEASESPQNMVKMAFRERLIKILERPDLRAALQD